MSATNHEMNRLVARKARIKASGLRAAKAMRAKADMEIRTLETQISNNARTIQSEKILSKPRRK